MLENFDIMDMVSPHEFYSWARHNEPVFFDRNSGYWVLTKFQDIKQVLSNEDDFSAELERVNYSQLSEEAKLILEPINFTELYGLSSTDNPVHDRVKKITMPIFNYLTSNRLKEIIEKTVTTNISKLGSECDIVKDFFYELPAEIIFKILGIPESDVSKVKEWSRSRLILTWGPKEDQEYHARNIEKYWLYCLKLLEKKENEMSEDLPSLLLEQHQRDVNSITIHEIALLCYGLIFSGHATTTSFLSECFKELILTGKWKEIREKNINISNTTDEMLRLFPSAFTRRRIAKSPLTIRGVNIPAGAKLLLTIGSGNRDEEIFKNPNEMDFYRKNSNQHLSFGRGFHYCIGAKLVKLEYDVVFEKLIEKYHFPRIKNDSFYDYQRNISIRSLSSLNVTLT